ncbi:helix-turn-helix transcriptional regulator [Mesorhizobium sp. B1-1-4]|nr:helix-turn-helix transcriptional regulator [Mesorhizobium sp. B1-1-4]
MKLAQYLSDHEMTDEAFAATVGMSQSQISRIKRGISRPSWDSVAAIERATGGQVTASDFAQAPDVTAAPAQEDAA